MNFSKSSKWIYRKKNSIYNWPQERGKVTKTQIMVGTFLLISLSPPFSAKQWNKSICEWLTLFPWPLVLRWSETSAMKCVDWIDRSTDGVTHFSCLSPKRQWNAGEICNIWTLNWEISSMNFEYTKKVLDRHTLMKKRVSRFKPTPWFSMVPKPGFEPGQAYAH
jgi:hypothetical protein